MTAYEIEILAKDGRRVTSKRTTKLVYQDGAPVGFQGIARDISVASSSRTTSQSQRGGIGQLAGGVAHDSITSSPRLWFSALPCND